ncbi:MAG: ACT domain-containing protein [Candidatus Bipolaricaulota bacterium]|nr:ACT domain-containing protein [Candidatus Bipolaricaulota bacterium]
MRGARLQRELIIRTDNRIGLLGEIARLLSDMGISIVSISVRTENGTATLHLLTVAHLFARDALRKAGFLVEEREVIVLDLPHHPGFLCKVAEALARKDLDLQELHATVSEGSTKSLVVFTTSHNNKAVQMLCGH